MDPFGYIEPIWRRVRYVDYCGGQQDGCNNILETNVNFFYELVTENAAAAELRPVTPAKSGGRFSPHQPGAG